MHIKKHIVRLAYTLTAINAALYWVASAYIYPNNRMVATIILLVVCLLVAITIIAELYVIATKPKLHKLIAIALVPVNIAILGFSVLGIAFSTY